jgi:hypothetical protein
MSNYNCSHCGAPAVVSATGFTNDGQVCTGHYCTACYGLLPESHIHHWRNIRHQGEVAVPSPRATIALLVGVVLLACVLGLCVITVLYS